jgi:hypothetical protein
LSSLVLLLGAPRVGSEEASAGAFVAPLLESPPVIDGVLAEGEWNAAARSELLYQVQPGDSAPPSEGTLVQVAYDATHLYVAVEASDSSAEGIRGRLTRRDDLAADDYLRLYLDTYDDRRRAYVFSINPLGIQADGLYNEGSAVGRDWEDNIDWSWDGVFESKGSVGEASSRVIAEPRGRSTLFLRKAPCQRMTSSCTQRGSTISIFKGRATKDRPPR